MLYTTLHPKVRAGLLYSMYLGIVQCFTASLLCRKLHTRRIVELLNTRTLSLYMSGVKEGIHGKVLNT